MAARIPCHGHPSSSSSMVMICPRSSTGKSSFRFNTSAHGSSSSPHLSFTAVTDKKVQVFEDQLRGIVCYRDENGEMICEGYDEGPRLGMLLPENEKASFPWPVGVRVTDFIQLATLQVFEDVDVLQLRSDQKRQL